MLDVEQSAHLKLPVMERAPDAAGPAWVRVADDALRVVEDGLAVRVDEIGALGSSAARMGCIVRGMDVQVITCNDRVHPGGAEPAAGEAHVVEHPDFLTRDDRGPGRGEVGVEVHELRTAQVDHQAAILGPLEADIPTQLGGLDGPDVEGEFVTPVAERRGVPRLTLVTRRRRQRREENHVVGLRVVISEVQVRFVAEQAQVKAGFELFGPLGPEGVRPLDDARGETAEPRLDGVGPHALGIPTDRGNAGEYRGHEVGIGFLTRLAVRGPQLAVAQDRPLTDFLRELPRYAALREPAAEVVLVERRGAVVPHRGGHEHLVVHIERRLTEVRRVVHHGLGIDRDVAGDGVAEFERHGRDERATHVGQLTHVAGVQVLAERQRAAQVRAERVSGRRGQIVVDLIVDQLALGHPPGGRRRRGHLGQALQPLIVRVVGAQRVVHLEPVDGHELGRHVAKHPADLRRVLVHEQ